MGEKYYIPPAFQLTDDRYYSVFWSDDNYLVFNGCVDRSNGSTLNYIEVSPWGFTRDIGSSSLNSTTKLLESVDCPNSSSRISTISSSRSVFDSPNFSPYEPFYFLGFLFLTFFVISFAFKTIFGRGYR